VHSPFAEIAAAFNWRLTVDRRLAMALERTAVRRSEVVVTHSQYNARTAARGYGLDLARIPVIPHGIPIPPATSARQSDGFLRLLYVGRLELRKGIHVLLDALPEVLDAVPEAEVVIVGKDFPTAPGGRTWREHALASLSAAHQRRVCFLGYVDGETVERLYDGCDLFLAPSLYESFGLVYLEAMARSCAVVGSRTAAIPEVVAEGETGLLVPPGDAKALADAVITLCRDHAQRLEMGRRGRERVKQLFDERTMVDRVGALYEQTVRDR
jgi:glycosyltransferase involved in cell wall biosynthesis